MKQAVEALGISTVLLGGVGARVTHHVDVGTGTEMPSFPLEHERSQVGATFSVVKGVHAPCTPVSRPLQHVNEFGDEGYVEGVELLRARKRHRGMRSIDEQLDMFGGGLVVHHGQNSSWKIKFAIDISHSEDAEAVVGQRGVPRRR